MVNKYKFAGGSANDYIIEKAPPVIRYMQEFITSDEELALISHIDSVPKPKWHLLADRRVQAWGGIVGRNGLIADSGLPNWLLSIVDRLVAVPDIFEKDLPPNHVLINDYFPGNGIMCSFHHDVFTFHEHTDGPAYYPVVATISLGSGLVIDYTKPINPNATESFSDRYIGSMFLEPRSLVVISDAMFSWYLHGIANRTVDTITDKVFNKDIIPSSIGSVIQRNRRISLTVRNIPKVRRSVASLLRK